MNGKDNVHYLDIGDKFLEKDGSLSRNIMPDYLHPNQKGYEIETKAILPDIKSLLKEVNGATARDGQRLLPGSLRRQLTLTLASVGCMLRRRAT